MAEQMRTPVFTSSVIYQDDRAALRWLENAFGFETSMVVTDDKDEIVHAEMRFGNGAVMIAHQWSAQTKSPKSAGGANTQQIHVELDDDIDGHCERARKAGATIIQEPSDQFYGSRTYRCLDPEGHVWTFGQSIKTLSTQEMEKASGLKVRDRL
jgi:uncharacterized glyoxalase superfamily protein PhnB